MKPTVIRMLVLLALALQSTVSLAQSMVVHEWGTFTSLQDESGKAIGGINTDDEPVPAFVHRLARLLLLSPTELPGTYFQGAPSCHPDVTMRLETPVIYFHPSASQPNRQGVSVSATFRGGWLSEFYPNATAVAPGINKDSFGALPSSTISTLSWNFLEIGGNAPGPVTDQHVWTSPRAVQAASVRTPEGETEKFLFYRGVANVDAPITIIQNKDGSELTLKSHRPTKIPASDPLNVKSLWLVDIATDGKVAYRELPPVALGAEGAILARTSSRFAPDDYNAANREKLKASLQKSLVADGLFADEAQALLNTWELSYFKSGGMRVFFLVPQAWTDYILPLKISVPNTATRVMVGRIELVTPQQRATLREIAQFTTKDITNDATNMRLDYYGQIATNRNGIDRAINEGSLSLAAYGVTVPKTYQLYLSLGRFRNALILEEAKKRPAPALQNFISTYSLEGYRP